MTEDKNIEKRDVVIIGGGISGTALYYTLRNYTSIQSIALIEKHKDFAQVSSHTTQNSQTLHFGDIETHYTLEKTKKVAPGAMLVKNYLEHFAKNEGIFRKLHKMVIAVGEKEVKELRERYVQYQNLFPDLKLLERHEIAQVEPKVIEGRNPQEKIVALYSEDGYTVDFYLLAKSFVNNTPDANIYLGTEVKKIEKTKEGFLVKTTQKTFSTKVLVVDAGAMSLRLAQTLGYGKNLSVFSIGGNFYRGPEVLNGKVYTMQNPKLPFAAVHGDPDVHINGYTRYGPTAKLLGMLERRNYKTVIDYFRSCSFSFDGFYSLFKILSDWSIFTYITMNFLYDVPFIGKRLFVKNVQKIIPTVKATDIIKDKRYGGTRPQIVDIKTHALFLGEARIEDRNVIFNITPSPGASTCLAIAQRDAKQVANWLGVQFDEDKFVKDLGPQQLAKTNA